MKRQTRQLKELLQSSDLIDPGGIGQCFGSQPPNLLLMGQQKPYPLLEIPGAGTV